MSVGVVTFWPGEEFVASNFGAKRWLSFYIFPMQAFGADVLCVVDAPVAYLVGYDVDVMYYGNINDVLSDYDTHERVVLTGDADKTLQNYVHPVDDVLYIFGDDYGDVANVDGEKLRIDNPGNVVTLWSHNCVAIALYDRYIKSGSN